MPEVFHNHEMTTREWLGSTRGRSELMATSEGMHIPREGSVRIVAEFEKLSRTEPPLSTVAVLRPYVHQKYYIKEENVEKRSCHC